MGIRGTLQCRLLFLSAMLQDSNGPIPIPLPTIVKILRNKIDQYYAYKIFNTRATSALKHVCYHAEHVSYRETT